MTFERIFSVTEKHQNCRKCGLAENRTNGCNVTIGQGMTDAIGLIIVPTMTYNTSDRPAVLGATTQELKMLKAIWKALEMDPDNWWITSTVACPGQFDAAYANNCMDRLADTIEAISPAIIVCCGSNSLDAFTGWKPNPNINHEKGWIKVSPHYHTFYTYDLSKYITNKLNNVEGWETVAQEIMEHWTEIAKAMQYLQK